jgi:hypothetical protein
MAPALTPPSGLRKESRSFDWAGKPISSKFNFHRLPDNMWTPCTEYLETPTRSLLWRVFQLVASPTRWTSPRVLKLRSLRQNLWSPRNAQGLTGAEGTPTSSFHATPSHDTPNIPQRPEPTEMPKVIPSSPQSYRLGAPDGPHTCEGSSMPSSRAQPRPFFHVAECLWDIPDFIQVGFHTGWFVTAVVDPKLKEKTSRRSSLA